LEDYYLQGVEKEELQFNPSKKCFEKKVDDSLMFDSPTKIPDEVTSPENIGLRDRNSPVS
jgi:hypothetical protein